MGLRAPELLIILFVALLIFGPKNLPKLGKSLGQTVKNVRDGMEGDENDAKKIAAADDDAAASASEAESEVVEADAVEDDVVFCSKCGAKNAADAAFCSKCGEKLA